MQMITEVSARNDVLIHVRQRQRAPREGEVGRAVREGDEHGVDLRQPTDEPAKRRQQLARDGNVLAVTLNDDDRVQDGPHEALGRDHDHALGRNAQPQADDVLHGRNRRLRRRQRETDRRANDFEELQGSRAVCLGPTPKQIDAAMLRSRKMRLTSAESHWKIAGLTRQPMTVR